LSDGGHPVPFEMSKQLEALFDYDELKREITEAIRSTLRELAAERGMSYEELYAELFGRAKRKPVSKRKASFPRERHLRRAKRQ
jgi:hypothetical protein